MSPTGDQHVLAEQGAALDTVYAETLRFFPDLVRELGGDPEQLMLQSEVDPYVLSKGRPVGYRLIASLMEHAARSLRCSDFGLRLAAKQGGGGVFGALGVVMRNAKTFGDGLKYVVDHCHAHSLAARVHTSPDSNGRRVFVGHDILVDRLPIHRQAIEQFLLLAHLNAVESTRGRARVREVRFRFQPLSSPKNYQRYFGCEVRFDQSSDGVVFSADDLHSPTHKPDAQLYAEATAFIDAHFTRVKPPLRLQVRAAILRWIEGADCAKERVAAELHMHPRTLHRRLNAEGTCFERIKDELRRDVALGYLCATGLSLQRIAEKVGYAEHSVLTRSCARWFAAPPREVRRLSRNVETWQWPAGKPRSEPTVANEASEL